MKRADPGARDDRVEPAHRRHRGLDETGIGIRPGQVRPEVDSALHVGGKNLCAIRPQSLGDCSTDSGARSCDNGPAAMQPAAHAIFNTSLPVFVPVNSRMKAG